MYASPDHLLEDVQLVLENEAKWYKWCTNDRRHQPAHSVDKMNIVRADEDHFANALKYYYCEAVGLSKDQRTYLRRYFLWRYTTDQTTPPPDYTADGLRTPIKIPVVPYPFKEKAMSLKFQTVFTLNGTDISKLPRPEIYAAIEVEEQRIEKLRQIKHRPKSLIAEIEAAEATLNALVVHLDSN